MTSPANVDLANYRSHGARVFAGRQHGFDCRKKAKLESHDSDKREVVVRIPSDTYAITSSFFLAMFGASIRNHGLDRFYELYSFTGWPAADEMVREGVEDALDDRSPL